MEGPWLPEREVASCVLFIPPKFLYHPEDGCEGAFSGAPHAQALRRGTPMG